MTLAVNVCRRRPSTLPPCLPQQTQVCLPQQPHRRSLILRTFPSRNFEHKLP